MDNKSKSKRIMDTIAVIGFFALLVVSCCSYIYKLITGKPTIHFLTAIVVIFIVSFVAMFITSKKYDSYREKDEEILPFWFWLAIAVIDDPIIDFVLDKADILAETATDVTKGSFQIIGIFTALFIFILLEIKAIQILEKKYSQYKKAKKERN